jgi:hypothetical protein
MAEERLLGISSRLPLDGARLDAVAARRTARWQQCSLLFCCASYVWMSGAIAEVSIQGGASVVIQNRAAVTVINSSPQLSTLLVTASALGTTSLALPGPAASGGSGGGLPAESQGFAGAAGSGLGGALGGGLGGFSGAGSLSGDAISLETGTAGPPPGASNGIRVPQVIAQFN